MSAALDPVIHPPARLQVMAILADAQEAEFAVLRTATGVSDSVLSKHLSALAEAGYLTLRKGASGGRVRTWVSATRAGKAAFRGHLATLQAMVAIAERAAAE